MIDAGVKRIYGIVGDSANSLVDAIHHSDGKTRFKDVTIPFQGRGSQVESTDLCTGLAAEFIFPLPLQGTVLRFPSGQYLCFFLSFHICVTAPAALRGMALTIPDK